MARIAFDSTDFNGMVSLMEQYGGKGYVAEGLTQDGEHMLIGIYDDHIVTDTFQTNKWVRTNYYWKDGTTEETFSGRWQ